MASLSEEIRLKNNLKSRLFRLRHKDDIIYKQKKAIWNKRYSSKYIERLKTVNKKYYHKNLEKYRALNRQRKIDYMNGWSSYFKDRMECEVCGYVVKFNCHDASNSVHFDHRLCGQEAIKTNPGTWLRGHICNTKNIAIWESCKFGILCRKCNFLIPTMDRKVFLANITRYINKKAC